MTVDLSTLTCDFCCGGPPSVAYPTPQFVVDFTPVAFVEGMYTSDEGAWAACSNCATMIERNALDTLVRRTIRVSEPRYQRSDTERALAGARLRLLYATILRVRGEAKTIEELAHLAHDPTQPIGVSYKENVRTGVIFDVEPIPPAGPHPLDPRYRGNT